MNQTPTSKIGFVGSGHIARVHAQALRALGGVEILAWSAQRWERAVAAAQEFDGEAMITETLLSNMDIEIVIISTPTPLHAEQAITAMMNGKHVFCEKPMARTAAQAENMIAAAGRLQRRLFIGHALRFFPIYQQARHLILSGAIGNVRRVRCRRLNLSPAGRSPWFFNFEHSGGCILDLMIHDFDFLNWCFGTPTRVEVETKPDKDPAGHRHAIVHLYFDNGVRAAAEGSWMHDRFEQSLHVEGDRGTLSTDFAGNLLRLEDKRGLRLIEVVAGDPFYEQMKHFLQFVRGEANLLVTPQDARAALEVALAGLRKLAIIQ
jgi:predicted dehydrogenase